VTTNKERLEILHGFTDFRFVASLQHAAVNVTHEQPVGEPFTHLFYIHVPLWIHGLITINSCRVDLVKQFIDVPVGVHHDFFIERMD